MTVIGTHMRIIVILLAAFVVNDTLKPCCAASVPQWDSNSEYRLIVEFEADRTDGRNIPVSLEVCFPKIFAELGMHDRLDANSIQVIAYDSKTGQPKLFDGSLPVEKKYLLPSRTFYSLHAYSSIANHVVAWNRQDTDANLFAIYFDTMKNGPRAKKNGPRAKPDYFPMIGAGEPIVCKRGRFASCFVPHNAWGDLDGDGLDDLVVGGISEIGYVCFAKNIGSREMPMFTQLERVISGTKFMNSTYVDSWSTHQTLGLAAPLLEDWDHDGDLDLYVNANSWYANQHKFYENVGDAHHHRFVPTDQAPEEQLITKFTAAEKGIADWNMDGQLERVSSNKLFLLYHASPDADGVPIAGCNMFINRVRPFDVDHDGDLDITIGTHDGTMQFCRNMGILNGVPYFCRPKNFPAQDADLSSGTFSRPAAADWDGDGDTDLFAGAEHGRIIYFENIGSPGKPIFIDRGYLRAGGAPITFHGDVREPNGEHWGYSSLTALDWDGDGDPDVMATERMGYTNYYENVGTKTKPLLAYSVRLQGEDGEDVRSNPRVKPGFHDWNDDGLIDLLIAEKSVADSAGALQKVRTVILYNTGSADRPTFKSPVVVTAPKGEPLPFYDQVEGRTQYCPIDWNSDGNMDFIQINHVAYSWPQYYENVGSKQKPLFERKADPKVKDHHLWARIGHATSICAIDWDHDGRDDVLLGGEDGRIRYFNRMMFDVPPSIKNVVIANRSGDIEITSGVQFVDIDRYALAGTVTMEDLNQAVGAENWIWNDNLHAHGYDALTLDQAKGNEQLVVDPRLQGLYDIYMAFDVIGSPAKIRARLSQDAAWQPLETSVHLGKYDLTEDVPQPTTHFEQVYWKEADMTGQKIQIIPAAGARVYLDYIRFVPQSRNH